MHDANGTPAILARVESLFNRFRGRVRRRKALVRIIYARNQISGFYVGYEPDDADLRDSVGVERKFLFRLSPTVLRWTPGLSLDADLSLSE